MLKCMTAVILLALMTVDVTYGRDWLDNTGKFKTDAELIDAGPVSIRLKKPDGEFLEVPIARLSKIDVDYLRRMHYPYGLTSLLVCNEQSYEDIHKIAAFVNELSPKSQKIAIGILLDPLRRYSATPLNVNLTQVQLDSYRLHFWGISDVVVKKLIANTELRSYLQKEVGEILSKAVPERLIARTAEIDLIAFILHVQSHTDLSKMDQTALDSWYTYSFSYRGEPVDVPAIASFCEPSMKMGTLVGHYAVAKYGKGDIQKESLEVLVKEARVDNALHARELLGKASFSTLTKIHADFQATRRSANTTRLAGGSTPSGATTTPEAVKVDGIELLNFPEKHTKKLIRLIPCALNDTAEWQRLRERKAFLVRVIAAKKSSSSAVKEDDLAFLVHEDVARDLRVSDDDLCEIFFRIEEERLGKATAYVAWISRIYVCRREKFDEAMDNIVFGEGTERFFRKYPTGDDAIHAIFLRAGAKEIIDAVR